MSVNGEQASSAVETQEQASSAVETQEQASNAVEIQEQANNDAETQEEDTRKSTRQRTLTEKGKEMHDKDVKKKEKSFNRAYDTWKMMARKYRTQLKAFCSLEDLDKLNKDIQTSCDVVSLEYQQIIQNQTPSQEILKRMEACVTLTNDVSELVTKRKETIKDEFNDRLEKDRVRIQLNKEEYGSVFGHTKTETISEHSKNSNDSSKRADAEAELAAKVEEAKAMKEIQVQQEHLHVLESEEARMLAAMKQQETEFRIKLEKERAKLQQLKADTGVKVAAARVRAYDSSGSDYEEENNPETKTAHQKSEPDVMLNPNAPSFELQASPRVSANQEAVSLAQAIASSLSMNRLPAPEPTIFSGDPMKFLDWKMTFIALIDRKPIPPSEKMFYLKMYLNGEAHKAVEGFFYRDSEEAYRGAWTVLQERYGNPFIIQKAFRDKLMRWPKINANDPFALREFADFLQGCTEAIPHVRGLAILNDCEENHKLLNKLPEWIVRKWSRIVVDELDSSGNYPSLASFTAFLNKEARIACNPIASPIQFNYKPTEEKLPKRARAFYTNMEEEDDNPQTEDSHIKAKPPCSVCKEETHSIVRCPTFASKTIGDKKAFIHQNNLCFGCLRSGHKSKECRGRHTCNTCSRRHPTCLHEERSQRPVEATRSDSATANDQTQEIHVISHTTTRCAQASATSNIVPVFVSSTQEPQKEVLTYALLDAQSDSTFILADLLDKLNVESQPVKLRLSTMTAVDTVITSKSVSGLQVRAMNTGNNVSVPQAYTRSFIPVDKSYIPTWKTALQWPHLKHLADKLPALQDCEVGLLIGCDCPSALAPLEVVSGSKNEPFAQRTELGWSIIGSSNRPPERQGNQSIVHRVAVKKMPSPLTTDVQKTLESDFVEKIHKGKYESQDDARFIQFPSDYIRQKELTSVSAFEEANRLIIEAQNLCKRETPGLHKFNWKDYMDSERATATEPRKLKPGAIQTKHALGIQRSFEEDTFSFNVRDQPSTRQDGLQSDDLKPRWEEWKDSIKFREVAIDRCYIPHDYGNIQLPRE